VLATVDLPAYLPIGLLVVMAIVFAISNLLISQALGQHREGAIKGISYESGMNPITVARKRFNVRFYILAMIFLVFDVEIIFLYPWASSFAQMEPGSDQSWLFFGRILFFLLTTVVAYLYAAKKGVFRFN